MILLSTGRSSSGFSRIGRFLRCPQSFSFSEVLRIGQSAKGDGDSVAESPSIQTSRPAPSKGTAIHLGLAHYYARIGAWQGGVAVPAECVDAVHGGSFFPEGTVEPSTLPGAVIVHDPDLFYGPEEAIEIGCAADASLAPWRDLAIDCTRKYALHYGNDKDQLRILAVETEHAIELGTVHRGQAINEEVTPVRLTMRADLVWANSAGRVNIVDHKTSARFTGNGSSVAKFYSRHGQFFGAALIGQAVYGSAFDGPRLNMVQTDGERFGRPALEPQPHALGAFRNRLLMAEQRIADLERETKAGRLSAWEWPAADHELTCYSRYGACEYVELCAWGPAALSKGA